LASDYGMQLAYFLGHKKEQERRRV